MEGCHVIIFISQNRNHSFPQTLAATINLHGSHRRFRPPSRFTHQQLNLAPPPRQPSSSRCHPHGPDDPHGPDNPNGRDGLDEPDDKDGPNVPDEPDDSEGPDDLNKHTTRTGPTT
ncbi:hypothetical protein DEO72_LG11g1877 [Vigna unguiculata]|uniref:Uncharacterized protein n=1 Tax=Vigna unguiculata TaxID=3917 RepID=A0A4D6NPK3_VIGUN|nr:hypothetical protein DEO72_LG11g1877 [Vigna unguiculata]